MTTEMNVFEVINNCRAMRRLKPDPVPTEQILRLIDAGNHAPSGSNMQGARWIVVQDQEQRNRLAELNKKAVEVYIGSSSGRPAVLPHQSQGKRERMLQAVLWQAEHLQEIPVLIIACFEFADAVGKEGAGRAGGSVWPGVQNLLLAARALGLGATPTTLGLADRDAAREVLGLADNVEAYCLIPVGWPLGNFGPVTRLPPEQTVHWDRW